MGIAIRIDDGIYNEAKKVTFAECRSIPGQDKKNAARK